MRPNAETLEALLEIAERRVPGYAPLIVLLAFTGMRIREALGCAGRTSTSTPAVIRLRWQLDRDEKGGRVPLKTDAASVTSRSSRLCVAA